MSLAYRFQDLVTAKSTYILYVLQILYCFYIASFISFHNKKLVDQTGRDGCICYFVYEQNGMLKGLNFVGLKRIKEICAIDSFHNAGHLLEDLGPNTYAIGFASADFIIWDLANEFKVCVCRSLLLFFYISILSVCNTLEYNNLSKADAFISCRFYKFLVVDGDGLILILLVIHQNHKIV